jgi:large subunit ribosomal protein L5
MPRLKDLYGEEIIPAMMERFSYRNVMEVPRLEKIVVNVGVGEALQNARTLDAAVNDLSLITGQRPVITRSHKSIAAFRLREGNPIGAKVTLRGNRMYDFLDRLLNIALPRRRDFRGVSRESFDGHGNYTLGLREQLIFLEVDYDSIDKIRGFEVTIVTTAKTDEEARYLLELLGMPFVAVQAA